MQEQIIYSNQDVMKVPNAGDGQHVVESKTLKYNYFAFALIEISSFQNDKRNATMFCNLLN